MNQARMFNSQEHARLNDIAAERLRRYVEAVRTDKRVAEEYLVCKLAEDAEYLRWLQSTFDAVAEELEQDVMALEQDAECVEYSVEQARMEDWQEAYCASYNVGEGGE